MPLFNKLEAHKHLNLLKLWDCGFRSKIITRQRGVPHGEKIQIYESWDFISPDPRSKRCAVRQSYLCHWFSRPFLFATKMQEGMDTLQDNIFNRDWYPWAKAKIKDPKFIRIGVPTPAAVAASTAQPIRFIEGNSRNPTLQIYK